MGGMSQKKRQSLDKTQVTLYGVICLLILLCCSLCVVLHNKDKYQASLTPAINVNLGVLGYIITNGRSVENSSPQVLDLKSYLTATAKKDTLLGCKTTYYNVIAATQNQDQVLLNYGCPYPNARMFATYSNGAWKLISSTNEFDQFDVPSCAYLSQNSISMSIAPVCVDGLLHNGSSLKYRVREG
jgi:hypothetical protein